VNKYWGTGSYVGPVPVKQRPHPKNIINRSALTDNDTPPAKISTLRRHTLLEYSGKFVTLQSKDRKR
ncbi:MAG: hypothetical protein K2K99_01115, partial [Muribaculaceae bacterium]|nr:hypothetical protein [Muribaculaceae bacterium]